MRTNNWNPPWLSVLLTRLLIITVVLISNSLYAQQGQLPMPAVALNAAKTMYNWEWARGNRPDAVGFRVYCGKKVAPPAQQIYDFVDEIPDKTARNLLILSQVNSTIKEYGNPVEVVCRVVAYNAVGESSDRTNQVPLEPTRVWWSQIP